MSGIYRLGLPAIAGVFFALLSAGCAMRPAHLDFASSPSTSGTKPHAAAQFDAPLICLAPLEDLRLDKGNIGNVGGRPFDAKNIIPWLEQELHREVTLHVQLVSADSTPALFVRPKLHKLYVDGLSVTKTAIVVLELSFTTPSGATSQRIYRGQFSAMNWWNSEDEMKTALGLALKDCLEKCGPDMKARTKLGS